MRSDSECEKGNTTIIKEFSDMPKDDQNHVISGAIFCIGIFIGLAYLAVRRCIRPKKLRGGV